ncbi:response regulator [Arundinibacter roseus]|uniref:Response regulator transcription factor n=1 Tax=Arundinibacter roseus TaxID=2070510 RepID=A0A4R4KIL0_9BACT|nr:response regulator transcription factor [Arundinibacter roseus]TDB68050.1 response regulator transcription factor [Arundinibacter roseus]
MKEIRVLLADDHEIVLDSLAMMISSIKGISVSTTATNGMEALEKLSQFPVDIVLSDMHMPSLNGIELALRMRESYPQIKLILLTMEEGPEIIRSALHAGVWGYVFKKVSRRELETALFTVAGGERYFTEDVNQQLSQLSNDGAVNGYESSDTINSLSKREIEIIRLIVNEVPTQEIADKLFISPKTVDTHRRNIFKKLDIHTVVALTRFAIKYKLI